MNTAASTVPNELELAVIQECLRGGDHRHDKLRAQIAQLRVAKRQFTGYGFFTSFALPSNHSLDIDTSIKLPTLGTNIWAELPGLKGPAGFMLYVDSGLVRTLEGFSTDEPWPSSIAGFKLHKSSTTG